MTSRLIALIFSVVIIVLSFINIFNLQTEIHNLKMKQTITEELIKALVKHDGGTIEIPSQTQKITY